jgi:hypothetical protein
MAITQNAQPTFSEFQHNNQTGFRFDQTGITAGADAGVKSITASIGSNAITVTLPALTCLDFRSTTLTTGTITQLMNTGALTLTIAATDSFGLTTAFGNQRLAILAINNAGTIELAASALYGGVNLDETGVITTATAVTTATGIKAAAVRTGVAYRVVGFVDATFTTAVGWGTLALVQGQGGQALAAMSSLGYGQTWQDVTVSRALATTYYNTTGRPISVSAWASTTGNNSVNGVVNGVQMALGTQGYTAAAAVGVNFIVPSGASYAVTSVSGTLTKYFELR